MRPSGSASTSGGESLATNTVAGFTPEFQVVQIADENGHVIGSRDEFLAYYTPATNANAREVAELFNADATAIVRVRGVWLIPTSTAVTGAAVSYDVNRISAVGTGGTTITPRPMDTAAAALNANITARFGSTGGATVAYLYFQQYGFNEETNAGTLLTPFFNLLPTFGDRIAEIVLRQNQGIQIKQSAANTVGLTGALIHFAVE